MMNALSPHKKGLFLATAGALFLTPDGLLIRLADANDWTVLFWRGLSIAVLVLLYQLTQFRSGRSRLAPNNWREWLCVFLAAMGSLTFVLSVTHTTVANALVILSAMSLFAAFFSLIFLKELIARRTWIAMFFAMIGIAIVFFEDLNFTGMMGNLFALGCALVTALYMTVIRSDKDINVPICFGWGSFFLACGAFILAPTIMVTSGSASALAIMGMLSVLAFACLGTAAKMIPAPEVTLLMLLETILGPVWVWAILSESPSINALIGGGVVIVTLALHALSSLKSGPDQAA